MFVAEPCKVNTPCKVQFMVFKSNQIVLKLNLHVKTQVT